MASSAGGTEIKTSRGDIKVGEVTAGSVSADTSFGAIGIGLPVGRTAWLDLDTKFGAVRNSIEVAERPGQDEELVRVRARTSFGDITISRSAPPGAKVAGPHAGTEQEQS